MAHKESIHTLTTWNSATGAWDAAATGWDNDTENAIRDSLNALVQIEKPSSKILYNIGCAHLHLGNHAEAEQTFTAAISKDEHMAIAYFQRGCVLVRANRLREALSNFENCQKRFHGRNIIDYSQLGLKYKLYMCEARHNCGVVEAMLGNRAAAEQHLEKALKEKVEIRHKAIEESIQDLQSGKIPSLIAIPHDAIYRPPKGKVDNLGQRNYLGKAKVISAVDEEDKFSGFVGPRKIEEQRRQSPTTSPGNTPPTTRNYLRPAIPTPDRVPSPTPPSKAQLAAASRDLSPKLKRMELGNKNGAGNGYKGDSSPKVPSRGAPLLPPRSNGDRRVSEGIIRLVDNLRIIPGARRGSEGVIRVGDQLQVPPGANGGRRGSEGVIRVGEQVVSARLPPPPSRPPPKLDRKPLPQLPTESSAPVVKEEVKVELHCNTTKVITVLPRSPLAELMWAACTAFSLQDDSIHLWYRRSEKDELNPILTEAQMQDTWRTYSSKEPLQLWVYSKR